jgi:cytochrome c oxidase subunit 2
MISSIRIRLLGSIALIGCICLACSFLPVCAETEPAADPPATEEGELPLDKEIRMYAESWRWTPSTIRVAEGTKLTLLIENVDSPRIFVLKAYGLKVRLPQRQETSIEFVADKVGTFEWRCGRPCGNGCSKMRGKLIVE